MIKRVVANFFFFQRWKTHFQIFQKFPRIFEIRPKSLMIAWKYIEAKFRFSSININFQLTLSVGRRPILEHAPLNLCGAKPSGQIISNQNGYCLWIYFYTFYFFEFLCPVCPSLRKSVRSKVGLMIFSQYQDYQAYKTKKSQIIHRVSVITCSPVPLFPTDE